MRMALAGPTLRHGDAVRIQPAERGLGPSSEPPMTLAIARVLSSDASNMSFKRLAVWLVDTSRYWEFCSTMRSEFNPMKTSSAPTITATASIAAMTWARRSLGCLLFQFSPAAL